MRGVNEHIHNHGAAIRIGAAFPGSDMPGVLQLLGCDLRKRIQHIVEGLLQGSDHRLLVSGGRVGRIEFEGWFDAGDFVEAIDVCSCNVDHLLPERHFLGIGLESVELGRHSIGHVERELPGNLPVLHELGQVEQRNLVARSGSRARIEAALRTRKAIKDLRFPAVSISASSYTEILRLRVDRDRSLHRSMLYVDVTQVLWLTSFFPGPAPSRPADLLHLPDQC
jgi:hypothetical protein